MSIVGTDNACAHVARFAECTVRRCVRRSNGCARVAVNKRMKLWQLCMRRRKLTTVVGRQRGGEKRRSVTGSSSLP